MCLVVVHHCITNVLRELLITLPSSPSSSPSSSSSSSSSSCQPCIQLVVRGTVHETPQKGTFIPPCGHSHSPQKGSTMRTLTLSPEGYHHAQYTHTLPRRVPPCTVHSHSPQKGSTMRTLTLSPEGYHHAQYTHTLSVVEHNVACHSDCHQSKETHHYPCPGCSNA